MGEPTSWRVIAAAAAGTSHIERALPCEDRVAAQVERGAQREPWLSIFVADGAGSAARGARGAELAVQTAARFFRARLATPGCVLDAALAADCARAVRRQIALAALAEDRAPREFACTWLGLVAGAQATLAMQIGDGGIVVDADGELQLAVPPMNGEYANMTRFITDDDAEQRLATRCWPQPARRAALFSDGLQRLALDLATLAPHAPLFERLFAVLGGAADAQLAALQPALLRFLDSSEVNRRTDDDKTLALAVRTA